MYGGTLIHEFWTPGSGKGQNFHLTAFVMGRNAAHLSALGEAGAIDAGALDFPAHAFVARPNSPLSYSCF